MKISELFNTPKNPEGTTSSATTSSAIKADQTQDIVPQDIVGSHPDHSAIAEGVSQIFRRQKGKAPVKGFRCTSGPRKGRIVASPSTCFMKVDPSKGAKIKKKRSQSRNSKSVSPLGILMLMNKKLPQKVQKNILKSCFFLHSEVSNA